MNTQKKGDGDDKLYKVFSKYFIELQHWIKNKKKKHKGNPFSSIFNSRNKKKHNIILSI